MRKEISLWPTSSLMKKRFASVRETVMRVWIICLRICKYNKEKKCAIFLLLYELPCDFIDVLVLVPYKEVIIHFIFVI